MKLSTSSTESDCWRTRRTRKIFFNTKVNIVLALLVVLAEANEILWGLFMHIPTYSSNLSIIRRVLFPLFLLAIGLIVAVPPLSATVVAQFQSEPDGVMALGSISGVVTDEAGNPLDGIAVSAYENSGYFERRATGALTNESGRYQVNGLRTGSYVLRFADLSGPYLSRTYTGSTSNSRGTRNIPVAGNHIEGVDISLQLGGRIAGKVDLNGHSVIGNISIYVDDHYYFDPSKRVYIDPDTSEYQTNGLLPGSHTICANVTIVFEEVESDLRECYGSSTGRREDATPLSVVSGEFTSDINFSLGNPASYGTISGTVRNNDDRPLEGISVIAEGTGLLRDRYAETDRDGNYKIPFVYPGDYTVSFRDWSRAHLEAAYTDVQMNETVVVEAGINSENIDGIMSMGGRITGTIAGVEDSLLDSVSVRAYLVDDTNPYHEGKSSFDEETGTFEISGLSTGNYFIEAGIYDRRQMKWFRSLHGGATEAEAVAIEVAENETVRDIDISIHITLSDPQLDGAVQGMVTAEGKPLAGIRITLQTWSPGYPVPIYHTESNQSGDYQIEGLPSVPQSLTFEDLSNRYTIESVETSQENAVNFTPAPNSPVIINAKMVRAGSLTGTIRDLDGIPVTSDIEIRVRRFDDDGGLDYIMRLTPDASGVYRAEGLLPGQYLLSVLEENSFPGIPEDERLHQQLAVEVLPGQMANAADAIIGAGVPLALDVILEPQMDAAIYIPFSTH